MCETFFCSVPDCESYAMGKEGFAAFESDQIPPVYLQCGHLCCRSCLLWLMENRLECPEVSEESVEVAIRDEPASAVINVNYTHRFFHRDASRVCASCSDSYEDWCRRFVLMCKFCDGAYHSVTPECKLQSFNDVISKHLKGGIS
ncbi:hypothetical protein PRIPAC_96895 [Pristionchus pacificus]|nr:hypothetical protein PRIPAC_96895 [Pristionchus pacificus]|eukprot:PDM66218.1 hypothetical protein PRIPAC_45443 [Pristionchus pacificus]